MNETIYRILAENRIRNNDTWVTGLNNNDIIIGPSDSGKTRGYVLPNIMHSNESMIIIDTKSSLKNKTEAIFRQDGYKIIHIDFTDCYSSYGYNPLDYIGYNKERSLP